MAIDLYRIETETDEAFLRTIIETAQDRLDVLTGKCRDCHGSGREPGWEPCVCTGCNGSGEDDPHEECGECGEPHPTHILDCDGNCPSCADELEQQSLEEAKVVA